MDGCVKCFAAGDAHDVWLPLAAHTEPQKEQSLCTADVATRKNQSSIIRRFGDTGRAGDFKGIATGAAT